MCVFFFFFFLLLCQQVFRSYRESQTRPVVRVDRSFQHLLSTTPPPETVNINGDLTKAVTGSQACSFSCLLSSERRAHRAKSFRQTRRRGTYALTHSWPKRETYKQLGGVNILYAAIQLCNHYACVPTHASP